MTAIIPLQTMNRRRPAARRTNAGAQTGTATILFFTGVRVERLPEEKGAPTSADDKTHR